MLKHLIIILFTSVFVSCSANNDVVSLAGNWQYAKGFDESFIASPEQKQWLDVTVPVNFRAMPGLAEYTGYVTLKKTIPLSVKTDRPLALFLNQLCDISIIYINKNRIGAIGSVEPYISGMFRSFLGNIPESVLNQNSENNIYLVLYAKKGLPLFVAGPEFQLGPAAAVYEKYYLQEILSVSLILIYLVVGLYHLLLYFKRKTEKEYLFFSLTSILISLYFLNRTGSRDYFFDDALFRAKFEFISLYGFLAFLLVFVSWLFYKKLTLFTRIYASFMFSLSVLTSVFSYSVASMILTIAQMSFLVYIPYVFYLLVGQMRLGNPDSTRLFAGSVILSICGFHDILVARDVFDHITVSRYGFFVFILGIAALLAGRFSRAFDESDRLNDELTEKNSELEKSVRQVAEARDRLEEKVGERTAELQEAYLRLQETDALKTSFFANLTHEIRTPLTLILSPLEEMAKDEIVNSRFMEEIRSIKNNALRLLKLITQILEVAKIDSSTITVQPARYDIRQLVEEITGQFKPFARIRGLEIDFNCCKGELVFCTDANMLETILLNLLSNAIKFTSSGRITVTLDQSGDDLVLAVKDTGIGILPEHHYKIFERFFQIEHGSNRHYEGTGVGLALSAEMAGILGGKITLESEIEKGSVFTLVLPQLKTESDEKISISSAHSGLFLSELITVEPVSPKKNISAEAPVIMVVEDNVDMKNHISTVLGDYQIITASNGREALELVRSHNINLIVSDIMMPEMDGFAFIRDLDKDPDLRHIPLVFLSALADKGDRFRGLYSGAVYFISKPFAAEELLAAVASALKRSEILMNKIDIERKRFYEDIHDNLGSHITDLLFLGGELQKRELLPKEKIFLLESARKISTALRNQLNSYERLVLMNQEFSMGLHLALLERYSIQNRILDFESDDKITEILALPGNRKIKTEIWSVCMEIATNDFKYGYGPSVWYMQLDSNSNNLILRFHAKSTYDSTNTGYGTGNIVTRMKRLNGTVIIENENEFSLTIQLPLQGQV